MACRMCRLREAEGSKSVVVYACQLTIAVLCVFDLVLFLVQVALNNAALGSVHTLISTLLWPPLVIMAILVAGIYYSRSDHFMQHGCTAAHRSAICYFAIAGVKVLAYVLAEVFHWHHFGRPSYSACTARPTCPFFYWVFVVMTLILVYVATLAAAWTLFVIFRLPKMITQRVMNEFVRHNLGPCPSPEAFGMHAKFYRSEIDRNQREDPLFSRRKASLVAFRSTRVCHTPKERAGIFSQDERARSSSVPRNFSTDSVQLVRAEVEICDVKTGSGHHRGGVRLKRSKVHIQPLDLPNGESGGTVPAKTGRSSLPSTASIDYNLKHAVFDVGRSSTPIYKFLPRANKNIGGGAEKGQNVCVFHVDMGDPSVPGKCDVVSLQGGEKAKKLRTGSWQQCEGLDDSVFAEDGAQSDQNARASPRKLIFS